MECEKALFFVVSFFVVSFCTVPFAGPGEGSGDGTVGDNENDVAGYGRRNNRDGLDNRARLCEGT